MTITSVSQWSTTAGDNSDIGGVALGEGVATIAGMNNAVRNVMAQVAAAILDGTFATTIPWTVATASNASYLDFAEDTDNGTSYARLIGPATLSGNVTVTLPGTTGTLALVSGALGTPTSVTLTNGTGLPLTTGVTGTLPVANGGTGAATLTANNVLLGNGTSAVQVVAPSTSGNVLTSNGTTWQSTAPATSGQPIPTSSTFAVGTLAFMYYNSGSSIANGATVAGSSLASGYWSGSTISTNGGTQSGTWTNRSGGSIPATAAGLFARTA